MLGFNNSNHGSSKLTLSCSSTDANLNELPTLNWPRAPFPQLKYPFAEFENENLAEEERCLQKVKDIVKSQRASGQEVGAIIVEPISSIANQMASPEYFRKLRFFAQSEGIPFIVDETKTGLGSSGKYWAHQHWYLSEDSSPDYVTFGGKSGVSGFYATESHKLNDEATSFQGQLDSESMLKVVKFGQIYKIAEKEYLLHWALDTSSFLKLELNEVAKDTGLLTNIRGYGLHIGFDLPSSKLADSVQRWMWKSGFNLHKVGPRQLGLRPSLTLSIEEAGQFRTALRHFHPNFEK